MRCSYCFYFDEANNRSIQNYGKMSQNVMDSLIKRCLEQEKFQCSFGFQGGEPVLAGLDFYKAFVDTVDRYNTNNIKINYSIQTNGLLLDREWVSFFKKYNFLVGISIDGPAAIHNSFRVDDKGDPTCSRVIKAARLLQEQNADVNVLTTVTSKVADNIDKVYRFFMNNGLVYQQYIPCLDSIQGQRGGESYSLSGKSYEAFLKNLFDVWYEDRCRGRFVYVQLFENIAGLMKGIPAPVCGYLGECSKEYVIEADGSVFPCDFYMLDDYCIGNITADPIKEIDSKRDAIKFIENSREGMEGCSDCEYRTLCMGGCRRNRTGNPAKGYGPFYYCEEQKRFFEYAVPKIKNILYP